MPPNSGNPAPPFKPTPFVDIIEDCAISWAGGMAFAGMAALGPVGIIAGLAGIALGGGLLKCLSNGLRGQPDAFSLSNFAKGAFVSVLGTLTGGVGNFLTRKLLPNALTPAAQGATALFRMSMAKATTLGARVTSGAIGNGLFSCSYWVGCDSIDAAFNTGAHGDMIRARFADNSIYGDWAIGTLTSVGTGGAVGAFSSLPFPGLGRFGNVISPVLQSRPVTAAVQNMGYYNGTVYGSDAVNWGLSRPSR
jgi:hypothetical protein